MEEYQDLRARQEARTLARAAGESARKLRKFTREQLDRIVEAIASAFCDAAGELAEMAVKETGFGNVKDKTEKNLFASRCVADAIRDMKTVGILRKDEEKGLWDIGVPVGVIAGIVPSTNPTSTVCYKAMIALKAGNAIVFSPHPKAIQCTLRAAEIVARAAVSAGAPEGAVSCLTVPSLDGCKELMAAPQVRLILATGGPGMVRAAYSSGKPAIGVGAGNGPAYIHASADVGEALDKIVRSKTFDNGTVCASEQSIFVERAMEDTVRREAERRGFYFMTVQQAESLEKFLFLPGGGMNPGAVGKTALYLAEKAGFSAPVGTKILVARENTAGRPYATEKLCPVLAFFVMENQDEVLKTAVEVLSHQGSGHTFVIHAKDTAVIQRFALEIPVSRFLVNTPATQGGIGASTNLFPAMTLGCGAVGGSSSSNNISPMDLVNIRRVAWDAGKDENHVEVSADPELVEMLTRKILERLG